MRISLALPLVFLIACPATDDVGDGDTGNTPVADAGSGGGEDAGSGGGEDAGSGGGGDDAGSGGGGEDAGGGGGVEDAGSGGGGEDAGSGGGGEDAGQGPRDAGPAGEGCDGAWRCVLGCDPQDMDCFTACMELVPPGQEGLVGEVINCMHQNHCEDEACVERSCVDAVRACSEGAPGPQNDAGPAQDGGHGGGGAGTSCPETMMCYINCPPNDDQCRANCVAQADPAHANVTDPLVQCIERNQCRDGACVGMNCQAEVDACGAVGGGEPPPGEQISCSEALGCIGNCNGNLQCMAECNGRVRPESRPLADALQACMMTNRCMDMTCIQQRCQQQAAACAADQ